MTTTSPATTRIHANLGPASLVEFAVQRGEGHLTDRGAFTVVTIPHTGRSPKDKFVVDERSPRAHVWWEKNAKMSTRRTSTGCTRDVRGPSREPGPLRPGPLRRRRPGLPALRCASSPQRLAGALRPQHVHPARRRPNWPASRRASPCCTRRSSRPTRPGTAPGPAPSSCSTSPSGPDPDRRHPLRRRDQEVDLHRPQLPAAGARRLPDALLGQHRARPVTRRSSSASRAPARRPCRPTRPAASSATTSTAGAITGVFNFEGGCYAKVIRLSAEGEPEIYAAIADLRHGPRKRGARPDEPGGRLRRQTRSPRTPASATRSTTSRTTCPAAAAGTRRTSSSSPPTPSACCRRSRG